MKRLVLISASFILASSAFAQDRCINAPVNVTGGQTVITSSGAKSVTEHQTYIYYASRRDTRRTGKHHLAGVNDKYTSKPLMLNSGKTVKAVPEIYNVSLTTPQSNVAVCPDSTVNIAANVNLEKVSSYTGNYPSSDSKMYNKVTKREYKMAERKKRKIERKEAKIARKAGGTSVDVKSAKA